MTEPRWLRRDAILAAHDEQITLFGGIGGVRDEGLLDSALGRPRNQWAYESSAVPELGAAYAIGICRNHSFFDGNKRTAFLAMVMFLLANGYDITATPAEVVVAMLELASGEMSDDAFRAWVWDHVEAKGV